MSAGFFYHSGPTLGGIGLDLRLVTPTICKATASVTLHRTGRKRPVSVCEMATCAECLDYRLPASRCAGSTSRSASHVRPPLLAHRVTTAQIRIATCCN
ncbi:hypothetical protein J6590_042504 [Homalodisca vitripennis]|nr:hypothetical protein J6590_042504 [Homalodisca vitripennis]